MVEEEGIKQVFFNLARNALEAMQVGGILRITGESPGDGRIHVVFRDTGVGIAPHELESVFKPFQTSKAGGTGLGLSIASRIVEGHGGAIRIKSTPGVGTAVTVETAGGARSPIILRRPRAEEGGGGLRSGVARCMAPFLSILRRDAMAHEHVLIVDDEESLRRFLGILLKKEGYEVTAVANGSEALAAFQKDPFDVVLTDIKMPGMSGIDLLRAIRASDPTVPVVVMTAYAALDTAIEAVNQGAFHYFIKQAKNEEIKLVVRRALEMRRLRNENKTLQIRAAPLARDAAHHRQERTDPGSLRDRAQGGALRLDRAPVRGERHGQGALRARDPSGLAARGRTVRLDQLRRASRESSRVRALRPRAGKLHRRDPRQGRALQSGDRAARSSSTKWGRRRSRSR